MNVYKEKFVPVIFPEEEYYGNIIKFIMWTLRHLAKSKTEGILPIPEELIRPITLDDRQKELAFSYIKTFKEKTGKILLLLVDNLNDIIERFTNEDQSSLREVLMTYDSILLIGSAPTLFDSIINHDKPLYNFFEVIWLKDLSFEDSVALLNRYAEIDGNNALIEEFKKSEPKLRAIHELSGGNPRLILSLYHMIVEGDITSVENIFLKILDELSPYFRERMRDLSEQQKEIIDVMARAESLLTPTEIAVRCYIPVNIVISQIKRLEKIGYIKIAKKYAKKVFYDFNEILFSLWRRMRIEAGRKRLGFIVRFLQIWFTKEELLTHLDNVLKELQEKITLGHIEIEPTCDQSLYTLGLIYTKLKKYKEAINAFKKIIEIYPESDIGWAGLGVAYVQSHLFEDAIEAFKKAVEIEPTDKHLFNLGHAYVHLFIDETLKGNTDGALKIFREILFCLIKMRKKTEFIDLFAWVLKSLVEEKKTEMIKIILEEIEIANQPELIEFLSPFSTLIKYLETKDSEIIDRLRHEERIVVEDMLRMVEDKTEEKPEKAKRRKRQV
ncbi:MAG: tetratricopeptide repeat protein [Nitrospirota bacterium]